MTLQRRIFLAWGLTVALAATTVAPGASAAPVRLDKSFGERGIVRTPLPPSVDNTRFSEVTATADGGALVRTGYFDSGRVIRYGPDGALLGEEEGREPVVLQPPEAVTVDGRRMVGDGLEGNDGGLVYRRLPDGSPDPTFGNGGVTDPLPFKVATVAALPSGKVLAAGAGVLSPGGTKSQPVNQVFVARLGADGALDPSFGQGGVVKLGSEMKVPATEAIHVQGRTGDGAEVVTETSVVALDASGKLDPSFGEGGRLTPPGPVVGAAAAADKALLVAGTKPRTPASKGGAEEFYVSRFTTSGQLDPSFGDGSGIGVLRQDGAAQAGVALFEPNGSVLIGGLVKPKPPGCPRGYICAQTPAIVRFTPEGRPDGGFGTGGIVPLSGVAVPVGASFLHGVDALAAGPGGSVFAAGEAERAEFVAAIGTDGSFVPAFGGGVVTESNPRPAQTKPIAAEVSDSGAIFVAAQTSAGMWLSDAVVVLRYSPTGTFDRSFGEGGMAYVPQGAQSLAVAPNGSTYLASASEATLTKLTPTGSLDLEFGTEGSVVFPSSKPRYTPWAVVRQGNGKLLVGGNLGSKHGPRPTVFRFLPEGKLDRTFGDGGRKVIALGRERWWEVSTMTVDHRGRILLGGNARRRNSDDCCDRAGALIRLAADGRLDRSFGRGGAVLLREKPFLEVESLAIRGGRVLAAATYSGDSPGGLLYSLGSDGRLDRRFGHRAAVRVSGDESTSVSVFSAKHQILLVRSGPTSAVFSFSPQGRRQPDLFGPAKRSLSHRLRLNPPVEPIPTFDGSSLLLAWPGDSGRRFGGGSGTEANLLRLPLR